MKRTKPGLDWIPVAAHFAFGAVVGVVILFLILGRVRVAWWNWSSLRVGLCGISAALLGGGLAGRFQQQLWVGDNYQRLPPIEPQLTRRSQRLMNFMAILGGVGLALGLFGLT